MSETITSQRYADFVGKLGSLKDEFPDFIVLYWDRDEFTVDIDDPDLSERPVTDAEWEELHSDFPDAVYGGVSDFEIRHESIQRVCK